MDATVQILHDRQLMMDNKYKNANDKTGNPNWFRTQKCNKKVTHGAASATEANDHNSWITVDDKVIKRLDGSTERGRDGALGHSTPYGNDKYIDGTEEFHQR